MSKILQLLLTWSNGCIKIIIALFNNLPVTFSIDGDGLFFETIMGEIKVVNKHKVALYMISTASCKVNKR